MAKLHELLAVDNNLEGQSTKCRNELMATFDKKRHLFGSKKVTFTSVDEGAQPVTEEQSDIQSTVRKELDWLSGILAKSIDTSHLIAIANTSAKADIVTEDGLTIAKDVPATSLLELEKRVAEIKAVVSTIPTLDPAKGFSLDPAAGDGIFKAREVKKSRTKKKMVPVVLYPATKEHQAQVKEVTEDVVIGTILEQEWSSLITPAQKADMLDRCEILLRAIKKARSRANDFELDATGNKIGAALLNFVVGK